MEEAGRQIAMDSSSPAVSVVIPCYRVTDYIADALDSLRRQTFRNFETILVNDGCPDTVNLERALQPYESEIRYLKQANGGPSGARNTAIQTARAPLIAFLDGDDLLEPDFLKVHVQYLELNPDIDVVYADMVYFGGTAWDGSLASERMPGSGETGLRGLLEGTCFVPLGSVARREMVLRAGLFDPAFRMAEDLDLWLRICRSGGKFAYCDQSLSRHRLRNTSASDDKLGIFEGAIRVYRKNMKDYSPESDERKWFEFAIRRTESQIDYYLGRKALYERNRREAIERLARANNIMKDSKLSLIILALTLMPQAVYFYIHRRYSTQYSYLH